MLTFDTARRTFDSAGEPLGGRFRTSDGKWVDSTGAFLVGELERLDQTLNLPQIAVTYTRDIDLREDVTIADEFSSYTQSQIASAGSLGGPGGLGGGKAWIDKNTTQMSSVSVDIGKIATPLTLWGKELKYTIPELESAAKMGRPINAQKLATLELAHQVDADTQAYIGDTDLQQFGLLNSPQVGLNNLLAGAQGGTTWATKSPDEILADINQAQMVPWAASGWTVIPNRVLITPANLGYISFAKVATAAGQMSIRRYIEENNILAKNGGGQLEILACKWCVGAGVGGSNRMVSYTKDKKYVRFPKTMLQRTPIQYEGIFHKTTYYCRIGAVEFPYPENLGYFDGN